MYIANKNLMHNGKSYPKGAEVKESDPGFKDLKNAGHLDESIGESKKSVDVPPPPPPKDEVEEVAPKKSKKK